MEIEKHLRFKDVARKNTFSIIGLGIIYFGLPAFTVNVLFYLYSFLLHGHSQFVGWGEISMKPILYDQLGHISRLIYLIPDDLNKWVIIFTSLLIIIAVTGLLQSGLIGRFLGTTNNRGFAKGIKEKWGRMISFQAFIFPISLAIHGLGFVILILFRQALSNPYFSSSLSIVLSEIIAFLVVIFLQSFIIFTQFAYFDGKDLFLSLMTSLKIIKKHFAMLLFQMMLGIASLLLYLIFSFDSTFTSGFLSYINLLFFIGNGFFFVYLTTAYINFKISTSQSRKEE